MHKVLPFVLLLGLIAFFGVAAVVQFNPRPADATMRNWYSSAAYHVLGRTSENSQAWYVNDILQQVSSPVQASDVAYWDNKKIAIPMQNAGPQELAQVLPASTSGGEKWIEVNLTEQKLYAHEGDNIVYTMLVSSGKKWTPTVEGEFRIWIKLRSTRMRGGSRETGDFYDLPNVPNTMYFYKGYGLHGAYWHHNFGHPMSHGCVNLSLEDAKTLFDWADPVLPEGQSSIKASDDSPGTRVVIHS